MCPGGLDSIESLPRVGTECIYQEPRVPDRYSTVRERSASDLASECTLQSANFVFEVLSLLTQSPALVLWWSYGLDGVADTLYLVGEAVADHGEVWRQSAIVIDE